MPQKNSQLLVNQPVSKANPSSQKAKNPKFELSYNAKRGIITGVGVVVLVLVVLLIYYPSLFPWNW